MAAPPAPSRATSVEGANNQSRRRALGRRRPRVL
uniref:Uncharacterized protein n=1 Tax=Arundo donax TaxID=35708 RepID=A0A0A8YMD2_ARUDO